VLHSEATVLRQELAAAKAAATDGGRAPQCQAGATWHSRQEVEQARAEAAAAATASAEARAKEQAQKMEREMRGMDVVARTLKKKLAIYEQRLLEQARKCADELNDLRSHVAGEGPDASEEDPAESSDDDEDADVPAGDPDQSGRGLGVWSVLASARRPPMPFEGRKGDMDVYTCLDDREDSSQGGRGRAPAGPRPAAPAPEPSAPDTHGTYRPPPLRLPDAI